MTRNQKGFTLVELLIVITVVSIMAASVISITNPTRWFQQARDTKRREIIHAISTAMNTCYTSNGGSFTTPDTCAGSGALAALATKGYLKVDYSTYSVPGTPASYTGTFTSTTVGTTDACASVLLEFPTSPATYWKYTSVDDKTASSTTGC